MGRKRHTPEQIITALREAEVGLARGKSVKLMSRELGITEQTYYRWRREYGGMKVSQARRLKELERENGRLKRAVADLTLDKLTPHVTDRVDQLAGCAAELGAPAETLADEADGSGRQLRERFDQRVHLAPGGLLHVLELLLELER